MLELGHPMHAFDLARVRGARIVVRRARPGERLRTLDGVDRSLDADDLVICDGEGPVALAGVMGGGESEIAATTTSVLFECAYFDARGVRRTARRHGLHTESSHRFERGVDWGDTRAVLARATALSVQLAGGAATGPAHVVEARPLTRARVTLAHDRVGAVLGLEVGRDPVRAILGRLGFERHPAGEGADEWVVPSFRPDVSRPIDLVEEIARVRGFDAIPSALPAIRPSRDTAPRARLARRARAAGVAMGLSEAISTSFASRRDLEAVSAPAPGVVLRNPMSEEQAVMRTSLLPGLLRAVQRARRHGEGDARLFSVGAVFLGSGDVLPEERMTFAAVLSGTRPAWLTKPAPFDVWDAKGLAEGILDRIVHRGATLRPATADHPLPFLHPRGASWIEVDGAVAGSLGPIHPDVADAFELGEGALMVVQLDLAALDALGVRPVRYSALPRFPASTRDLALVVRDGVPAGDVERAAREAAGEFAEHVTLFDRFVGGAVPAGHASLGLRIVYRAPDRTLTDAEVDARHAAVIAAVHERFGAKLRA
jgi:phenylalanyl-tRNA synthetase beta chain